MIASSVDPEVILEAYRIQARLLPCQVRAAPFFRDKIGPVCVLRDGHLGKCQHQDVMKEVEFAIGLSERTAVSTSEAVRAIRELQQVGFSMSDVLARKVLGPNL